MMPTISFITCVYNASLWLERCLLSIANQDDPDFEAIVVNDGSTDDSQAIIDKFCSNHSCFRAYSQPNKGTVVATNFAVRQCRGDYIVNVDNDDWIEPNLVSSVKKIATNMHPSIVSFLGIDNYGHQFPDKAMWPHPIEGFYFGRSQIQDAIRKHKLNYFTHTTQAISRHLMLDFPFIPPSSGADGTSMIQIYACICSCYVMPEPLYHYTYRVDSQSHIHPINEPIHYLRRLSSVLPLLYLASDRRLWPLMQLREIPELLESANMAFLASPNHAEFLILKKATSIIRKHRRMIYNHENFCLRERIKFLFWMFCPFLMRIRAKKFINNGRSRD